MKKIANTGHALLQDIIVDLDQVDSIRCFFATLFLARDQKVDLEQVEDNIKIILIKDEQSTEQVRRDE
jgi:segregation and condensation protein A